MDAPTRLGRYSLLKKLASGSALETFLARRADDIEPGGEVVLRKLRPKVAEHDVALALFRREFELARGLEHDNLARVLELVDALPGEPALVVEFVWGEDLRRIAERGMTVGRFLPLELAVRVALETSEALSFLHERRDAGGRPLGLVHAFVAPSNLLVSFNGAVKLVDFGLARAEEQLAEHLRGRRRQLKYAYMSPEQVEGGGVDHRSDLFSLGTVLYEYTTRKRLFKGSDEVSTMKLVSEADVRAPSESIPSYPPDLERIVLKALAREPAERYQSALELRDDLRAYLADAGAPAEISDLADYMTGVFPDRLKDYDKLLGEGYRGPRPGLADEIERELALAPPGAEPGEPRADAPPASPPKPPATPRAATPRKSGGLPELKLPPLPVFGAPRSTPPPVEPTPKAPEPAAGDATSAPAADLGGTPEAPAETSSTAVTPPRGVPAQALDEHRLEDRIVTPVEGLEAISEPSRDDAPREPQDARPPRAAPFPLPSGVEAFGETHEGGARPSTDSGASPQVPIPELLKRKESDSGVITAVHTLRKDVPDAFEEAAEKSRVVVKAIGVALLLGLALIVWYGTTYQWPWEGSSSAVDRPDVDPLPPPQPPATIPVQVTSIPSGAAVSVNGVIAEATTPATVPLVPHEPNTLVFFMDGYETQVLDLPIGGAPPPEPLSVSLVEIVQPADWVPPPPDPESDAPPITEWAPTPGRINVQTNPPNATILLNGRDVCRSPCEFGVIAQQEQHITARLPGYLDTVAFTWAFPWDAENDTRFLAMTLREDTASAARYSYLELNSTPTGARVRINGERQGRTQANAPLRVELFYRVELEAPDHHSWARSFYPTPGRFEVRPLMDRIRTAPAQLSLFVDTPGFEETRIYLGPNELATGALEAYTLDGGTYELTLSHTPPPGTGGPRRRSVIEIEVPSGLHVTERYAWADEAFELVERTTGPLVEQTGN
jgi:eukaryotic-like serine/threonine-protein kinase